MPPLPDLHRLLADDPGLSGLLARVRAALDPDPGHDLGHSMRVALWTLLKLQHAMCTPRGVEEARRRSRVIEDFLRELSAELEVPLPAGVGRAEGPLS